MRISHEGLPKKRFLFAYIAYDLNLSDFWLKTESLLQNTQNQRLKNKGEPSAELPIVRHTSTNDKASRFTGQK